MEYNEREMFDVSTKLASLNVIVNNILVKQNKMLLFW